jgi:hypothetical protein
MTQNEMPMTASERVRKFRQLIKGRQRRRFEACVDVTVIAR